MRRNAVNLDMQQINRHSKIETKDGRDPIHHVLPWLHKVSSAGIFVLLIMKWKINSAKEDYVIVKERCRVDYHI